MPSQRNRLEIATRITQEYEGLDCSDTCAFALISDDLVHIDEHLPYICHAPVARAQKNWFDEILTSWSCSDPLSLRYFEFLRNVWFAEYGRYMALEKLPSDGVEPIYFMSIRGLDVIPAPIVYNMCIASRHPSEYSHRIVLWDKLVNAGVHPKFAFALCNASFKGAEAVPDQTIISLGFNGGHWSIDLTADVKTFMQGPKSRAKPWKECPSSSTPCNTIWGSATNLKPLVGSTIRTFAEAWKKANPDHEDLLLSPG